MSNNTVLLVDDEKPMLELMSVGLRKNGYKVLEASSAAEARKIIEDNRPDLAVLDVNMPEENGIVLGKWLNEKMNIPFIILTGYGDKAIIKEGIDAGALSYLVKPVEVTQLVPVIELAMQRAEESHQLTDQNKQLHTALDSSREISIAIGIVMARQQLTKESAFEYIRKIARSNRIKVADIATDIVAAEDKRNSVLT